MDASFFPRPADLRAWFEEHHDQATELLVGYYKKKTGRPSITWAESVDQALCFGWIDGIRRSIDETSYSIRFTPRKKRSNWSTVNVARVAELTRTGLMQPVGLAAFEARASEAVYSYEQRQSVSLDEAQERIFRANKKAWEFFQSLPAGYRKTATHWVVSAKREETRLKRLAKLIEDSVHGRRVGQLTPPSRQA
jgi:uncharacterized protein YdeI (YjbR/CyaY-like superfamily)